MKFKKIYHALTADPQNKWKESWHETVDVDESHAEEENKNFDLTGVKYEAVEIADAPPLEHTGAINGSAESVTASHLNDDVLKAQKDIVQPTEEKEKAGVPIVEAPLKHIIIEQDLIDNPDLVVDGVKVGDEIELPKVTPTVQQ